MPSQVTRIFTLLLLTALVAALSVSARAAIGIYQWYPSPSDPAATIHYRLNTDAQSGDILIKSASTGMAARSITLTDADLTKGPHAVTWLGGTDAGPSAPTGNYYAEIQVQAAPVAGNSPDRHDFAVSLPGNPKFYGVAVDNNPAHNDQSDPSRSTYGLVYACDPVDGAVEVFYPDAWTDGLAAGQDGSFASLAVGTTLSGDAPWGISVGSDGRLYTSARFSGPSQGFYNISSDGTSLQFGRQDTANTSTLAFGSAADGSAYQLRSVDGGGIERVKINPGYSYRDDDPADVNKVANIVLNVPWTPFGFTAGPDASLNSPLWITTPGLPFGSPSVTEWTWTGTSYSPNPSWTMTADPGGPANQADGVDISSAHPSVMAVGCERSSANLVLLNTGDGSLLQAFTPASGMVHDVKFDAHGNIVMDCGGTSRFAMQPLVSVFFPPDAGSSDDRTTITFHHTQGDIAPSIVNASVNPTSIRENDSDSAAMTVDVTDPDGAADIASVTANLADFGYSTQQALSLDSSLSPTTNRYTLGAVRAKPASRAGSHQIQITARDRSGAMAAASVTLTLVGGQISGTVIQNEGGFAVPGATVTLTDSMSGNIYSTQSSTAGQYTAAVNPGVYTIRASKPYYGPGTDVTGVTDVQDETLSGVNPTLGSLSVFSASSAPSGTTVCVRGIVSAQSAAPDWNTGGQTGFSNGDGRSLTKWYIRDPSSSATPIRGIAVLDDAHKPARGDLVVVEGTQDATPGFERDIEGVSNFANLGPSGDSLTPETVTLSSLSQNAGNLDDLNWGRYVRIDNATVVPGSQSSSAPDFVSFQISDTSTRALWTVKLWKSLGATASSLPADNAILPIRALVTRLGFYGANCLEPTQLYDIVPPPVDVASVGEAKSQRDGTTVVFTVGQIVTLASVAQPGLYYVESPDGSAGIRVQAISGAAHIGDVVTLSGRITTDAVNERVIDNAALSVIGSTAAPVWMMNNESAGGADYTGSGGMGLNNQGLLVRVYGRVTKVDGTGGYFLIDDGSGVDAGETDIDGSTGRPFAGIRVIDSGATPMLGQYLSVVGVISSDISNGKQIRVLMGREGLAPGDVTVLGL